MATIQSIEDCPPLPAVEGVEFRRCPSWLGYIAGTDGSLWSCIHRYNKSGQPRYWRRMRYTVDRGGYQRCHILNVADGKPKTRRVHSLICEAFHGPCPDGLQCCHNDSDKTNNRPTNLRWDTPRGNTSDTIACGRFITAPVMYGETAPWSKLSNTQVSIIRANAQYPRTDAVRRFAIEYHVSESLIWSIMNGNRRPHG
jgi:hypothetical protein